MAISQENTGVVLTAIVIVCFENQSSSQWYFITWAVVIHISLWKIWMLMVGMEILTVYQIVMTLKTLLIRRL